MNCYFIAQIKIKDSREYQKYIEKVGDVFKKYKGEYLAADDDPRLLEGEWNYTRIVVIRFKCEDDFNEWYNSKEYQEILKYRLAASDCDTVLVKGIERDA